MLCFWVFPCDVLQIGPANPRIQKVLDALSSIKTKVEPSAKSFSDQPHAANCSAELMCCVFVCAGEAGQLLQLPPQDSPAQLAGLLDLRRLPHHAAAVGERHLDRVEGANQCQPCSGTEVTHHSPCLATSIFCTAAPEGRRGVTRILWYQENPTIPHSYYTVI